MSRRESAPDRTVNSDTGAKENWCSAGPRLLPPEYKGHHDWTCRHDIAFPRATISPTWRDLSQCCEIPLPLWRTQTAKYTGKLIANSKLDSLEIQTRTIEHALSVTPRLAGQLFEEDEEDRASCADANVEDVSPFYLTAAKIIEDGRITTVYGEDKKSYLLSLVDNMEPQLRLLLDNLSRLISWVRSRVRSIALNKITASDDAKLKRMET